MIKIGISSLQRLRIAFYPSGRVKIGGRITVFGSDLASLLLIGISFGSIRHCGDFWWKIRGFGRFEI
ncbi:hypothetical protein SUGI_0427610 [Cryptomeria japonica]|nr:hypothetical protein SUGI_0427610 [Cryptomeria japonica]